MDKKLLAAFNNLSVALQHIADVMSKNNDRKESGASEIADALKQLDINEQVKSIQEGVKKIQEDNKVIVNNQRRLLETVHRISQNQNRPTRDRVVRSTANVKDQGREQHNIIFDGSSDPKNKKTILDGVKVVLLMAASILAIGLAFKIIGKVDWKSVIALAVAMPFLVFSYEKISKVRVNLKELATASLGLIAFSITIVMVSKILQMTTSLSIGKLITITLLSIAFVGITKSIVAISDSLKLIDVKNLWKLPLVFIAASVSIAMSSWVLQYVAPVSFIKLVTVVFIAAAFAMLGYSIDKMTKGVSGVDVKNLWKLPLVLVAASAAITASSWILQGVKPVGFLQLLTTVFIAGAFAVISFGLGKIIESMKDVDVGSAEILGIVMPLVLIGISFAIAKSSHLLGMVRPITFAQALTSIMIGAVFVVMSFGLPRLADGVKKVGVLNAALLSVVLIALSAAIYGSALILQNVPVIEFGTLINIAMQAAMLMVIGVTLGMTIALIMKLGMGTGMELIKNVAVGASVLVILAGAVMLSSLILSKGDYSNAPGIMWSLGTAASLGVFAIGVYLMNKIFNSDIEGVLMGSATLLIISGVIAATSQILSLGDYTTYPGLGWVMGTGASILGFSVVADVIGAVVMTGIGAVVLAAGAAAMLLVAGAIVATSLILSKGDYSGGPSFDWALGTGLLLGVYATAMTAVGSLIVGSLGVGWLAIKAGSAAIKYIAQSIVDAAAILKSGNFTGGPSRDWAEGVSLSISAFAPVFKVLSDRGIIASMIGSGVSMDDMRNAIVTISQSIVWAGDFFGRNKSSFNGTYPSSDWAEGVGAAISAFAPVFQILNKQKGGLMSFMTGSGPSISDMNNAIVSVCESIRDSSIALNGGKYTNVMPDGYIASLSGNIKAYADMMDYLKGKDIDGGSIMDTMLGNRVSEITRMADDYDKLAGSVKNLASSIESINLEKISALKTLTGSIVLMSLMDPGQFELVMDALENKAKIFVNVIKDLEEGTGGNIDMKSVSVASGDNTAQEMLEALNRMDAKLGGILQNSGSISSYVNQLRAEGGGKKGGKFK